MPADKTGAEKAVADIKAKGGKAIAVQGDVSKPADVKRLFEETRKAFGKLDVLVNNAGVFKFAPSTRPAKRNFNASSASMCWGRCWRRARPCPCSGREGGSVINISSIVSRMGIPGSAIYAGTKGALDTITQVLASELGPRKIRVNSINPGMVESEGTHAAGFIGSDFQKGIEAESAVGPHRPARRRRQGGGVPGRR